MGVNGIDVAKREEEGNPSRLTQNNGSELSGKGDVFWIKRRLFP